MSNESSEGREPNTQQIPIVSASKELEAGLPEKPSKPPSQYKYDDEIKQKPDRPRRYKRQFNHLMTDPAGTTWLTIASYSPNKSGFFSRTTYTRKEYMIELDDSPYVDKRLALKVPLIPTEDERKIYFLRRLHWWSHGPEQIRVVLIALVGIVIIAAMGYMGVSASLLTLLTVCLIITSTIWYFVIWMKWAYRFLVFTNKKIRYPYRPPFNLDAKTPNVDYTDLTGGVDHSSTWLGNTLGYGTLSTETPADKVDDWIKNGINYVPSFSEAGALLDQLRENALNELHNPS